ncbi:PIG-L family deacetylase [Nocardioides sp. GY 10127]|uniref:PIG-L deacetylase family protein n=1 Tax=Nocardioides sp. GY 10127 TaxID=2569762 RepID=UPI0010A77924|nr:PIG-L family deacetylase [Nocardioides sp. GY 10127]TIC81553.1 PIG-L family deacetylase [Nocardioides sp. GY 10127]
MHHTWQQTWQQHPSWGRGPALELENAGRACDRLVVVSAHPDDESLGVGGLIATAHRAGLSVYVVLLTAGESSHPPRQDMSRHSLATLRLGELDRAVEHLAPGAPVVFLGAPDTGVTTVEREVVTALTEIVGDGSRTLLVAPWREDGHPDHEAAGRAAAEVAEATGARLVEYPLLMWRHVEPADAPWERMSVLALDADVVEAKREAIRCHASQVRPRDLGDGDAEASVGPASLALFEACVEHVLVAPQSESDDSADPRLEPAGAS